MLHNVFISYSRQDLVAVDQLAADLERAGVPIWVDRRDIPVSIPWFDEVQAAIEASDLVVACQTPAWHGSQACQLELEVANANFKRVLLLDFATTPAHAVLAQVIDAYRNTGENERVHTEVTARAAMWSLEAQPKRQLLRGNLLKRARALLRQGDPPLTPLAGRFVRSSLRRRAVARTTLWSSTLAIVLAVCTGGFGLLLPGAINNQLAETDAAFNSLINSDDPAGQDPYEELARAKARVDNGKQGFLQRTALVHAMSVNFVESSYRYETDPVSFSGRFTGADAEVVDAQGRAYLGGRPVDNPAPAVAGVPYPTKPPPHCCTSGSRIADTAIFGTDNGMLLHVKRGGPATVAWRSGNSLPVADVAISADATRTAVALRHDGWIRVLTVPDFTLVRSLVVAQGSEALAFSPDGRYLAAGAGAEVSVFDLRTGIVVDRLRGSLGTVKELAWSPEGERIWAITSQRRVSGWLRRTGTVVLSGNPQPFMAAAGPSRSGIVVAVDKAGQVVVIDPAGAAPASRFAVPVQDVVTASTSRQSDLLAVGGEAKVALVDLTGERGRLVIEVGDCLIMDVALNRPGDRVYVACLNEGIRAFDTAKGQLSAQGRIDYRQAVGLTVTDTTVFVSDNVGEVHAFDPDLTSSRRIFEGVCGQPFHRLSASADGRTIVLAGDAVGHMNCMYEAHLIGGRWQRYFNTLPQSPGERARAVALTPDGRRAAIGLSDGTIRFWEPESLDPQGMYHQFAGEIRGLAYSSDGSRLVAVSTEGLVMVLAGCPLCHSVPELQLKATNVLQKASDMGLY